MCTCVTCTGGGAAAVVIHLRLRHAAASQPKPLRAFAIKKKLLTVASRNPVSLAALSNLLALQGEPFKSRGVR